jgi:hypothetical protein
VKSVVGGKILRLVKLGSDSGKLVNLGSKHELVSTGSVEAWGGISTQVIQVICGRRRGALTVERSRNVANGTGRNGNSPRHHETMNLLLGVVFGSEWPPKKVPKRVVVVVAGHIGVGEDEGL